MKDGINYTLNISVLAKKRESGHAMQPSLFASEQRSGNQTKPGEVGGGGGGGGRPLRDPRDCYEFEELSGR